MCAVQDKLYILSKLMQVKKFSSVKCSSLNCVSLFDIGNTQTLHSSVGFK